MKKLLSALAIGAALCGCATPPITLSMRQSGVDYSSCPPGPCENSPDAVSPNAVIGLTGRILALDYHESYIEFVTVDGQVIKATKFTVMYMPGTDKEDSH